MSGRNEVWDKIYSAQVHGLNIVAFDFLRKKGILLQHIGCLSHEKTSNILQTTHLRISADVKNKM